MKYQIEHRGYAMEETCREVEVSFELDRANVIYGKRRGNGWFYVLPHQKIGGTLASPNSIEENQYIIGRGIGDEDIGEAIAHAIADDYENVLAVRDIVQEMEIIDDILVENMVPGKPYGFEDKDGYCSTVVSCVSEDESKIYFLRLNKSDSEDYYFSEEEDEKVECWPKEYLESLLKYKEEDYGINTSTLYGLYDFAGCEVYNLPGNVVDFEKIEYIPAAAFANRMKLNTLNEKREPNMSR